MCGSATRDQIRDALASSSVVEVLCEKIIVPLCQANWSSNESRKLLSVRSCVG